MRYQRKLEDIFTFLVPSGQTVSSNSRCQLSSIVVKFRIYLLFCLLITNLGQTNEKFLYFILGKKLSPTLQVYIHPVSLSVKMATRILEIYVAIFTRQHCFQLPDLHVSSTENLIPLQNSGIDYGIQSP